MFESLFMFIIEFAGELILQVLVEVVFRGVFGLAGPFELKTGPRMLLVFWIFTGLFLGALSLLVVPDHLVRLAGHRVLLLMSIPILLGTFTWAFGRFQDKRDKLRLPMDSFWYGFSFGLAFSCVRFLAAG